MIHTLLVPIGRTLPHVILLVLLYLALALPVAAQGAGTISGQVTLRGEEALPEGLTVELLFLPNGQGPPQITGQPLAADGNFLFTEVDTSPEHRYLVRVDFEGEEQYSDLLAFSPDQQMLEGVSLPLAARTSDASALTIPEISLLMDASGGVWTVAGLYRLQNAGDRTIVNLTDPPLTIPLPAEAFNVQFGSDIPFENVSELPNGFSYSGPIAPGETNFLFSYNLPYQQGQQAFTFPVAEESATLRLLVPDLGQQTSVPELTAEGTQQTPDGLLFQLFTTDGALPDQLSVSLTNLPAPAPAAPSDPAPSAPAPPQIEPISPLEELPWWAPLLPVALAMAGVAAYLAARPAPTVAENRASLRERRERLLSEIALLDERWEAGEIGEQTHRRQRAALKNELKRVLHSLHRATAS